MGVEVVDAGSDPASDKPAGSAIMAAQGDRMLGL